MKAKIIAFFIGVILVSLPLMAVMGQNKALKEKNALLSHIACSLPTDEFNKQLSNIEPPAKLVEYFGGDKEKALVELSLLFASECKKP